MSDGLFDLDATGAGTLPQPPTPPPAPEPDPTVLDDDRHELWAAIVAARDDYAARLARLDVQVRDPAALDVVNSAAVARELDADDGHSVARRLSTEARLGTIERTGGRWRLAELGRQIVTEVGRG